MRFRDWYESDYNIRGEYWIQDGFVDFADGDVGDRNHEIIARDAVISTYAEEVSNLAEELGLDVGHLSRYGEWDYEALGEILRQIYEVLEEQGQTSIDAYIMQALGCNADALAILSGGGDGRQYAIDHLRWIAIRSNNVELYGYDANRQREIAIAIRDIFEQEQGLEDVDPTQVELTIYDHQSGKSWYVTLEDLEQPQVTARPQQAPMTVNRGYHRDPEENKYSTASGGIQKPWNIAAQKAGIGMELWRGTSENTNPPFYLRRYPKSK